MTAQQPINGINASHSMLPTWHGFTDDERHQMIGEDLHAGRSVSLVLTAIIFIGMVLGIIGVVLSLNY